jgi:diacylglycerol O-acyltransferase / wax synthase
MGTPIWFERLSGLDATFLYLEDRAAHMHVGGVHLFEGPAPAYRDLLGLFRSRLDRVPRYRQRLAFPPLAVGRPVWVDESEFDLEYHVRHTALPAPGGEEQLKNLAGRLLAQRLDRDKPLWEFWLVEGVEQGRFAVISKTHHCMIDGISGVDLAGALLDADPAAAAPSGAPPWTPRPAPGPAALAAWSLLGQVTHPLDLLRGAFDASAEAREAVLQLAGGLKPLLGLGWMGQAPDSSLNRPIGPHRRLEMVSLDLAAVKEVRRALGGTVNDVLLAVVAGALRTLLRSRGQEPKGDLRAMVPVSIRGAEARGTFGNQVAAIFCPLPVGEADPVARLHRVSQEMRGLKESRQAVGALALTRLGEFAPPALVAQAARLEMMTRFMNVVVTNVPGPQFPLYLLGRKLVAWFPVVPLAKAQTVGVALLSYDGRVGVGLLGDADRARDLPVLAGAFGDALGELTAAAREAPARAGI